MSRWQFYFFASLGLATAVVDQLIKGVLIQSLDLPQDVPVSPLINSRLALGLPVPFQPLVLLGVLIVCVVIFGALGLTAYRRGEWIPGIAWSWLTFGTLGNFLDRLQVDGVIDYLPFLNWTKFNLSDVLIVGGMGLLLVSWRGGACRGSHPTSAR